ncbi:MAG: type II toxin-antitoxin system prevent-host-death family antitoxin [Acidobacteria bacterium]|nr:type II toxin-antitoxin system prevent-host-death family antitoxin [Acidobacteriota bacterium]MCY3965760.1 type II toxin-antitoxin system prevent-host-death family antitoxin [Acidobacteriota bacterium]
MRTVSVTAAKAQLSRLLVQVERGEDVVITRHGEPVAKLMAYRPRARRQFGALRGRVSIDERFFEPLPEAELAAWAN